MTALWTAADAAAATGGRVTTDWQATGVSIDTRTLEPGDLFVALKDVRDGHDFVADALAKGAAAALVSRLPEGVAADAPLLIVDDVFAALQALGKEGRARSDARVVAVTGSVGKTSTKEMLRAVLKRQFKVHAAEASYNNHWGVPLTLARLPQKAELAIIEIGMNHPGEIEPLARLSRPHVAIITTVAPAHMEAFESLDGIAREKASIFRGLEPGGRAIYHGDLDTTPILASEAQAAGAVPIPFGEAEINACRLTSVKLARDVTIGQALIDGTPVLFKIASPGRHFAVNAVGVLGVVSALGADLALAASDLGRWLPYEGRGRLETIALDTIDESLRIALIDDAYNANPTSLAAALEVLATAETVDNVGRIRPGRRIAVLGDMLELGQNEMRMHAEIAGLPTLEHVDLVHTVGPRMRALHEALPTPKRGTWTEHAPDLAAKAHSLIDAGDVLLVKGSKGSRVSLVVDAIRKLGHPLTPEFEGSD